MKTTDEVACFSCLENIFSEMGRVSEEKTPFLRLAKYFFAVQENEERKTSGLFPGLPIKRRSGFLGMQRRKRR
jgi:hypothetical protein